MRQAREKRCLAPTGMVESLHGEEFAVDPTFKGSERLSGN
jgi:hypothetical protein